MGFINNWYELQIIFWILVNTNSVIKYELWPLLIKYLNIIINKTIILGFINNWYELEIILWILIK